MVPLVPDNSIARVAERPQAAERVTPAEFWEHVKQTSHLVNACCLMIVTFVSVNVAFDIHAMTRARIAETNEIAGFRRDVAARADALLWKLDTQTEQSGVTNKILADALVKMRAQVQKSTDTGIKTATATTTIAREAVKQAAATTQLVQAVQDAPPAKPVVNVEVPHAAAAPVIVQPAAPPAPIVHTGAAPAARHAPARRWPRWFLPWKWHGST